MNHIEVITVFLEEGYQISPDAVELICCHCSPQNLLDRILKNIDPSVLVVDVEHINGHINEINVQENSKTSEKESQSNDHHPTPKILTPVFPLLIVLVLIILLMCYWTLRIIPHV